MDFTSKIKNFLATASNTAGNYFKKTVQPEVQQLPQQVSSFGKTLLGNTANFINTAPAAVGQFGSQYLVQPTIQNIGKGAESFGRMAAYQNPVVNMDPVTRKQYGVGSNYTIPQAAKDFGSTLKGFGSIMDPVGNVIGGGIGVGMNAVGNLIHKQPLLQNANNAYRQGFDFSATLNPIGSAANALPLNRIAPAFEKFVPKVGELTGKIAEGATKEFVKGMGYGAVTGENPITTGLGFAPFGALEPFMPKGMARAKGATDNIIGIHPDDITEVSNVYRRLLNGYKMDQPVGGMKAGIDQLEKDQKYINGLFEQHISSRPEHLKLPFEDKVKALFNQAQYDFRNRTPAFGLLAKDKSNIMPEKSTPIPQQQAFPENTRLPSSNLKAAEQINGGLKTESQMPQLSQSTQSISGQSSKTMPPLRERISQEQSVPQNAGEYVSYLKDKFNKLYTQAIDRFHPLSQLGKQAGEDKAMRNALTGYYGTGSIANYHVDYELAPILREQSRDDLTRLAIAQRDAELAGRGIQGSNTGYNTDALKQQWGEQKFNQVQGTLNKLYQYQDSMVKKYLVDTGVMSQESYNAMKQNNQKYIPLKRVMDKVDEYLGVPQTKGAGSVSSQNVIKGIKGSERQIIDPLQSIVENTYKLVGLGKRQEVAKTIVGLKDKLPEGMIRKITGTVGDKSSVSVFENGKVVKYQVPPEVADAAKGLTEEGMNIIVKMLAVPTKLFRATATGYNPEFMVPNIVRDAQSAFVNVGVNPLNFVKGLAHIIKGDEMYQEFLKSGGQTSRISLDQPVLENTIKDIYSPSGFSISKPSDLLKIMQKLGDYSEQPTRVSMFEHTLNKSLKAGMSPEEARAAAAYAAQEGTVNFARRGSKTAPINAIYAFLNARAQGVDRLVRTLKNDPVGASTRIGMITLAPALATYAWNRNFKSYNDPRVLTDSDKQNNFVIMLSDTPISQLGGAQYIKIPKGDIGKIANPIEAFLSYIDGKGGDVQKALVSTLKAFSPMDNEGDLIPTALRPPIENAANYNFFSGQQIVPEYKKNYPAPYQYSSYTSPTYKMLGKELNQSPAKIQNLVEGYGTGIAKIATGLTDKIMPSQYVSDRNEQGQMINKTPVLRRFIGGEKRTSEEQALIDEKKATANMYKIQDIEKGMRRGDIPIDAGLNQIKSIQNQQVTPTKTMQTMGLFGGDGLTKDKTVQQQQTPYESKLNDSIAKIELLNSGQPYLEKNGKVYIKTDNNTAIVIDPNKTIEAPKMSGISDVDKELIKDYKSSITSQVSDIVELYKIGKLTAEEASKKIQALHGQSGTYNKPKKPKLSGFKVTMPKVSKGFRYTVKQQKVKVPKLPELKSNLKALSFKGKPLKLKKL